MGHIDLWPEGEYYLQIPKFFFEDGIYSRLSVHAKLLYGILLDRMHLSFKNGWADEGGNTFIYYSVKSAAGALHCGKEKIMKVFGELERAELITRVPSGVGRQYKIYVHAFKRVYCPVCG